MNPLLTAQQPQQIKMSPISEHVTTSEVADDKTEDECEAKADKEPVGSKQSEPQQLPHPQRRCSCTGVVKDTMKQRRASLNLPFNSKPDTTVMEIMAKQRRPFNQQQLSPTFRTTKQHSPSRMRASIPGGKPVRPVPSGRIMRNRWRQQQDSSYSLDCTSGGEASSLETQPNAR